MNVVQSLLVTVLALSSTPWSLPKTTEVREIGPRTYRFTVQYTSMNTVGEVIHRQRIVGDYTRGLPNGEATWKHVVLAAANGPTGDLPEGTPRTFMEGLTYRVTGPDRFDPLAPDFFRDFPADAVLERNLVWDTEMFEGFGQAQFPHLVLNEPFHVLRGQNVDMPGVGRFQNQDVELTWVGRSRRNGRDCAVIDYTALMNPFEIENGGMKMRARSHYWGQIWVSLANRQIEYATLYEVIAGEMTLPGATSAQPIHVLRRGVFAPVEAGR